MGKFHAHDNLTSFTMDTVEYTRQEDGFFHIQHPSHVEAAGMHGMIPVPEGVAHPDFLVPTELSPIAANVQAELDAANKRADDAIAEKDALNARLGALEKALAERPAPTGATDTASQGGAGLGDTSGGAGDTPTLPTADEIDVMTRDEAVEYLDGKGVAIAANSSKVDAHAAVTSYVAANTKA